MVELNSLFCTSIYQQHTMCQACNSFVINNSLMPSSLIHNRFWGLILIACYDFDLDHSLWSINSFLQATSSYYFMRHCKLFTLPLEDRQWGVILESFNTLSLRVDTHVYHWIGGRTYSKREILKGRIKQKWKRWRPSYDTCNNDNMIARVRRKCATSRVILVKFFLISTSPLV